MALGWQSNQEWVRVAIRVRVRAIARSMARSGLGIGLRLGLGLVIGLGLGRQLIGLNTRVGLPCMVVVMCTPNEGQVMVMRTPN